MRDQRSGGQEDTALLEYLRGRRWFGEKGAAVSGATIADEIPVQWRDDGPRYRVARARVDGETAAHYQLFLTEGKDPFADALEQEEFARGLVDAFAAGCTFDREGVRWIIQSESEAPLKVPPDAKIRLSSAEQSNTSIVIGEQAILKLFRKVAPGVHPDLEVTRFLTIERRFLHTPALLGTIHFADREGTWAAGMLQELVPGATDAWSHALECARPWFTDAERPDTVPFVGEAERLGAITREMHETLASGDPGSPFERRAATPEDLARWTESTVAMARRALASLERAAPDSARTLGGAEPFIARIRENVARIGADAGAVVRIHGDYHLGQVLRSMTDAFLIVDFEGEPARPLEERRRHQSPLRDVAGMLRSFAYAAALGSRKSALGDEEAAYRRATWEDGIRDAFLRGYLAERTQPRAERPAPRAEPGILPGSSASTRRLIELFETEKAFYELQYEIDHRPDWRWIPERALRLLAESRD